MSEEKPRAADLDWQLGFFRMPEASQLSFPLHILKSESCAQLWALAHIKAISPQGVLVLREALWCWEGHVIKGVAPVNGGSEVSAKVFASNTLLSFPRRRRWQSLQFTCDLCRQISRTGAGAGIVRSSSLRKTHLTSWHDWDNLS